MIKIQLSMMPSRGHFTPKQGTEFSDFQNRWIFWKKFCWIFFTFPDLFGFSRFFVDFSRILGIFSKFFRTEQIFKFGFWRILQILPDFPRIFRGYFCLGSARDFSSEMHLGRHIYGDISKTQWTSCRHHFLFGIPSKVSSF